MTLALLRTLLDGVLPGKVAYYAFPEGEAKPLPFICYYSTGSDNFGADNVVFHSNTPARIELYEKTKDFTLPNQLITLEKQLEDALTASSLFWEREETYVESERCFLIIYEVTLNGRK